MPFFEVPKLEGKLQGTFPNTCRDKINSSHPRYNRFLVKLADYVEEKYLGVNKKMRIKEYSFRSHMHIYPYNENDTGYYRVYDSGSNRAVIVVPQRSSYGYNSTRLLASYLASNGFNTYEIVTPFHEKRLPEGVKSVTELPIDTPTLVLIAKQAIEEILGLVNILKEERREEKIGIAGISQGAGYAVIASGIDSHIESSVYIHGFGDIANLLLYSNDRFARHFRDKSLGSLEEKTEILLREELNDIEPLTYVRNDYASNVIMINSRWDSALPKNNVMALWKKLGEPEIHWFYGGHVSILINSKKVLKKILRHFRRTLK